MRRAPIVVLSGLTAALIATAAGIASAPASSQRQVARPAPTRTVTSTVTSTVTRTVTATVTAPGPTVTVPGPTTTVTQTVTANPSPTSPSPTPTTTSPSPTPTSTPPGSWLCTTTDVHGRCGTAWEPSGPAWCNYTGITGVQGGTNGGCPYTDQNVWSPLVGETQTLHANNPGDWQIVSNTPVNPSGSVTTFPNVGAPFNEQPLSNFSTVSATVSETMPHNAQTSGWAMMDNWFDNWKYEIMIQHDFTRNGPCTYAAVATFNSQLWGLCTFGSSAGGAYAWKLAAPGSQAGDSGTVNQGTITIDIKAMVDWLVAHGYMTANPTITNLSDGWEICSTGGTPETFAVSQYSLTAG